MKMIYSVLSAFLLGFANLASATEFPVIPSIEITNLAGSLAKATGDYVSVQANTKQWTDVSLAQCGCSHIDGGNYADASALAKGLDKATATAVSQGKFTIAPPAPPKAE